LISLKKLNRETMVKIRTKAGLTDPRVRETLAVMVADGAIPKEMQTGIESALRKSRRKNARYQAMHVHGDQTETTDTDLGAHVAETRLEKQTARAGQKAESVADGKAEKAAEKVAEYRATAKDKDDGTAELRGVKSTDGENTVSSVPGIDGLGPDLGPRFQQTQRMAAGKVAARARRDNVLDKLAWEAFEVSHPTEAEEITKVQTRATRETLALAETDPDGAFAIDRESWLKKYVRPKGQALRRGQLMETWGTWQRELRAYRQKHPATTAKLSETLPAELPDRRSPELPRYEDTGSEPGRMYQDGLRGPLRLVAAAVARELRPDGPASLLDPPEWWPENSDRAKAIRAQAKAAIKAQQVPGRLSMIETRDAVLALYRPVVFRPIFSFPVVSLLDMTAESEA
jgi:hypothetical protein